MSGHSSNRLRNNGRYDEKRSITADSYDVEIHSVKDLCSTRTDRETMGPDTPGGDESAEALAAFIDPDPNASDEGADPATKLS